MTAKRHRGKFDPSHTPKGDNFTGCDIGRYANDMMDALKLGNKN